MTPGSWNSGYKGMTLLHLASALGYSKLVCTMLAWRADNPSVILETEIDALSQDNLGYTPLVKFVGFDFRMSFHHLVIITDVVVCSRTPRNSIDLI